MATGEQRWTMVAVAGTVAALGIAVAAYGGYVKDDAFISLRYARNLVAGHGLVFNPGERVEGFTNFLWVLLGAPALVLGVDPVVWLKALGLSSALGAALVLWRLSRFVHRDELAGPGDVIAPLVFATSTSVALWSMSGLEGCFLSLCSAAALLHLHRGRASGRARDMALASAWLVVASFTRPEGHALWFVAAVVALAPALRARRLDRGALAFLAPALLLLPYHAFRILYFGEVLPNTFLVKASGGAAAWGLGIAYLGSFLAFNANGALVALGLAGATPKRDRALRLHAAAVCGLFLLYLVSIGGDEMKHFRLYLPAFPLLCLLAAEGVRVAAARFLGARARAAMVLAGLALCAPGVVYTLLHHRESTFRASSAASFQAMGRWLETRAHPGDACVFQDMGGAPWAAPSVRFVDALGIVDRRVAHEIARAGLSPFLRWDLQRDPAFAVRYRALDARLRERLLAEHTRWIALVAYVRKAGRERLGRRLDRARADGPRTEDILAPRLRANEHSHGLYADPRFARDYRFVRAWKRDTSYYLALFERR